MSGFVKGQHTGHITGIPRIVGRLTDEQIRDHYCYQARDVFGKAAIEELARTEHKTPEEIRKICGLTERKDSETMVTPEIKAAIINDARAGFAAKTIAAKYGLNEKTVGYHLCEARKRGELPPAKGSTKKHKKPEPVIEEPRTVIANEERVTLPPDDPEKKTWALPNRAQEQEELEKTRHPEAYPGQIYDEIPQAVKDRESKVEVKIRDYYAEKQPCLAVPNPFRRGAWEELSLQLTLTLRALLGLGAVCTARSYDEEESLFQAFIRDAEGRKYKLKLEEIK